jgi:CheY-like chemotaxis protein
MADQASILVVDDEPLIAMLIADWLGELGCRVVGPVGTAADALALIEKGGLNGVLLDVTLGTGNSFDLAERAQVDSVPVGFITGHSKADLPPRLKGALVLSKPFLFDDLKSLLDKLLGGAQPTPTS